MEKGAVLNLQGCKFVKIKTIYYLTYLKPHNRWIQCIHQVLTATLEK